MAVILLRWWWKSPGNYDGNDAKEIDIFFREKWRVCLGSEAMWCGVCWMGLEHSHVFQLLFFSAFFSLILLSPINQHYFCFFFQTSSHPILFTQIQIFSGHISTWTAQSTTWCVYFAEKEIKEYLVGDLWSLEEKDLLIYVPWALIMLYDCLFRECLFSQQTLWIFNRLRFYQRESYTWEKYLDKSITLSSSTLYFDLLVFFGNEISCDKIKRNIHEMYVNKTIYT